LKMIMEQNIGYYLFLLAVIIIGFIVIKKVTTCLLKSAVFIVMLAVLAYIYYMYYR